MSRTNWPKTTQDSKVDSPYLFHLGIYDHVVLSAFVIDVHDDEETMDEQPFKATTRISLLMIN